MLPQTPLAVGLAAVALSAPLAAQVKLEAQPVGPPKRVHLDYATGIVTRGVDDAGTIQALVNEVVTLDNTAFADAFYAPGAPDELANYGRTEPELSAGLDYGGPVCEFTVGYATNEPDDLVNPPVSLEIAFYSNNSGLAGDCSQAFYPGTGLGVEVARFTITGLPGDTDPTDGLATAWETTVDLRGPQDGGFLLPPGEVAWTIEVRSDPSSTGPLLVTPAAAFTCSPPNLNPLPGTSDCFDVFSPGGGGGACAGSFSFTTPGIASFWMRIVQEKALAPAPTTRSSNGFGAFIMILSGFGMVAGCDNVQIPCPEVVVFPNSGGTSLLDFWSFSRTPVSIPIPGIEGDLLIALPPILELIQGPGSTITVPGVPASCDLVGLPIYSQGGIVDAFTLQISLTQSLDFVIGTYLL